MRPPNNSGDTQKHTLNEKGEKNKKSVGSLSPRDNILTALIISGCQYLGPPFIIIIY
jgi:hypothetical protein